MPLKGHSPNFRAALDVHFRKDGLLKKRRSINKKENQYIREYIFALAMPG